MYSLILHGRRSLGLQKWRHLRVSVQNVSAFSNYFSSASVVADVSPEDGQKGHNFTISYLVDSLGLPSKLAESISGKVSFEDKGNSDSVLNLFRSHGFTDYQISGIISNYPRLLILDAEKSLGPKLQFLQSRGASTSELTKIVTKVPKILGRKEGKSISLFYDLVKDILREEEEEADTRISPQENINRNVLALRESGVPQKLLSHLLNSSCRLPVYGKEKFEESLKKVVEMGFDPTTSKFLKALRAVYSLKNETIEEKVNVYKSLGFGVEDVWAIFKKYPIFLILSEKKIAQQFESLKKCGLVEDEIVAVFKKFPPCIGYSEQKIANSIETFLGLGFSRDEYVMIVNRFPQCIGLSAETVKKKTEFLVKKMNWPLKALILWPHVISYNLEKRIVPRCNVIKALMSKGLLGSEIPPMSSVLACTDQVFLNRYVVKHDDKELVAELMAIFTGKRKQIKLLN